MTDGKSVFLSFTEKKNAMLKSVYYLDDVLLRCKLKKFHNKMSNLSDHFLASHFLLLSVVAGANDLVRSLNYFVRVHSNSVYYTNIVFAFLC